MAFPTANRKTPSRRRNQRGGGPFPPYVVTTIAPSGSTLILTFSSPVNISGNIAATVATRTFVSQHVDSPTQVTITMSGTVAGLAYAVPTPIPQASTYQGGQVLGASGTFP